MKTSILFLVFFSCFFGGCASYSAHAYRQNMRNLIPNKQGVEVPLDASWGEYKTVSRTTSLQWAANKPFIGDSINGFRGVVINKIYNSSIAYTIFNRDRVPLYAGGLRSVEEERQRLCNEAIGRGEYGRRFFSVDCVIDTISIPFGEGYYAEIVVDGTTYSKNFNILASPGNVFGNVCHWNIVVNKS